MHRAKKAISALRSYLGRDAQGIKLLDDIAKIVNELRKEASGAREEADQSTQALSAKREALLRSEQRVRDLELELAHERSLRSQRERDVAMAGREAEELRREIEELTPSPRVEEPDGQFFDPVSDQAMLPERLKDPKALTDMITALFQDMKRAPAPSAGVPKEYIRKWFAVYDLQDIVRDYTGSEMMKLGRFVALMAIIGSPAIFRSTQSIRELKWRDEEGTLKLREKLMWWMRAHLRRSSVDSLILGPIRGVTVRKEEVRSDE